jgi:diguanylate cyclase (GGDEF)-like protein
MATPLASRLFGWRPLLVLGLAAVLGYYFLPTAGVAQAVVLSLVGASGAAFSLRMARRRTGQTRVVWGALGAAMTLTTLANLPDLGYPLLTGRSLPFPSPVNTLWLLTYPCLVLAVLALARLPHAEDYAGNFLDAAIVAVSGGIVLWTFLLEPIVDNGFLLGSVAYPTLDMLFFLVVVRLLRSTRGARNTAGHLLVASFAVLLAGDVLYAVELHAGSYHLGGPCDGVWMLSYLLLAVAAVHPAAGSLTRRTAPSEARFGTGRLARVAAALDDEDREPGQVALHDALTGLASRSLLFDRLERSQARGARTGAAVAVLFVDLDGFQNVNDTLGRDAGDRLLRATADRLTLTLRDADTIARPGADEFVIVIDEQTVGSAAELVAERILEVMREPFELSGAPDPVVITASIGVATGWHTTADELLRDAGTALGEAKTAGRDCFAVFGRHTEPAAPRRNELELELRRALAENQFQLRYQPIYDLDRIELVAFEALLRWNHPLYGLIGPDEFIPVLEASGQIVDVGRWVLGEACRQMADWHGRGSDHGVSVNVSGRQLDDDSFVEHVTETLRDSGLEPRKLTLEIGETTLMRNPLASARRLRKLKRLGVRIAVDDFGTGYSSLAHLEQFPVDSLKIDRAFTDAIDQSPESKAPLHTLVQLGRDRGLTTLAVGVETNAQVAHLRAESFGEAQGFLLARPMTAGDVEAVLFTTVDGADALAADDAA